MNEKEYNPAVAARSLYPYTHMHSLEVATQTHRQAAKAKEKEWLYGDSKSKKPLYCAPKRGCARSSKNGKQPTALSHEAYRDEGPREPFAQSPARPTAKCGRGARRGADVQLARRSEAAAALAADLLLPPLVHALPEAAHRIGHAALLPAGRSAEGGANGSASGHISATPRGHTPRWLHLGCPRTRRPPPCRVRAHLNSVLTTRPAEARRATARARAPTRRRAAAAPGRGARASVRSRATARPVPTGTPPRPVVGACVVGRSACGRL